MAELRIVKVPKKILRGNAQTVDKAGEEERQILSDMVETMYINRGVGLAAVQVGIDKQLAVVDVGQGVIKMINPVIVKREAWETEEEGCLSVPDTIVKVKRAAKIVVSYMNEKGEVTQLKADGLLARAIQHEIDHLSGKLIIDYLNPIRKMFSINKFK